MIYSFSAVQFLFLIIGGAQLAVLNLIRAGVAASWESENYNTAEPSWSEDEVSCVVPFTFPFLTGPSPSVSTSTEKATGKKAYAWRRKLGGGAEAIAAVRLENRRFISIINGTQQRGRENDSFKQYLTYAHIFADGQLPCILLGEETN